MERERNIVFIDGQNLYSAIRDGNWFIDFTSFMRYLRDKYNITDAYYFFGCMIEEYQGLYTALREAGFTVVFKDSTPPHTGGKKGNVDSFIVFSVMRTLLKEPDSFDKVVLVTGDGDFYPLVRFLIEKGRLEKVLHPAERNVSSLYKELGSECYDFLDRDDIKSIIESKTKRKRTR